MPPAGIGLRRLRALWMDYATPCCPRAFMLPLRLIFP
jgi:hypothetical protein